MTKADQPEGQEEPEAQSASEELDQTFAGTTPDLQADQTVGDPELMTTQASAPDRELPNIPEVEIVREIGRGGMGVVYQGRQSYLERNVAVKLLKTREMSKRDDFVRRFQREAKLLAGMTHPHIVGCYQAGTTSENDCYLVMEFVDGPNLLWWIRNEGALSTPAALEITRDIARALEHAHGSGIIHRDVKPENILLSPLRKETSVAGSSFTSKLTDLGLARPESQETTEMQLTMQGVIMGTPSTMAPEQFDNPKGVDFRADIYGLGCVLYQALTAKVPFPERSIVGLVRSKTLGTVPNPRDENGSISKRTAALVMDMLCSNREERPATYSELISRCEELLREELERAKVTKVIEEPKRSKAFPLAMVGVGVALIALFAVGFKLLGGDGSDPKENLSDSQESNTPINSDLQLPGTGGIEQKGAGSESANTPTKAVSEQESSANPSGNEADSNTPVENEDPAPTEKKLGTYSLLGDGLGRAGVFPGWTFGLDKRGDGIETDIENQLGGLLLGTTWAKRSIDSSDWTLRGDLDLISLTDESTVEAGIRVEFEDGTEMGYFVQNLSTFALRYYVPFGPDSEGNMSGLLGEDNAALTKIDIFSDNQDLPAFTFEYQAGELSFMTDDLSKPIILKQASKPVAIIIFTIDGPAKFPMLELTTRN